MEDIYFLVEIPSKAINKISLTVIDRVYAKSIKLAEDAFYIKGWFINALIYCPETGEKLEYNYG